MNDTPLQTLLEAGEACVAAIGAELARRTRGGRDIDDHQVAVRQYAGAATRMAAAHALAVHAAAAPPAERERAGAIARLYVAEVVDALRADAEQFAADLGLDHPEHEHMLAAGIGGDAVRQTLRALRRESAYRDLAGEAQIDAGFAEHGWIAAREPGAAGPSDDDLVLELRTSTRRFARERVAPLAQRIHIDDLLVPDEIIDAMGELGFFGMSLPAEYGGAGMSNLMMVVATEELSAASLPAAGSLITRPEVICKALLAGGTEAQKQRWLPPLASGEMMAAVSVTEPDTGSDVASLRCRATRAEVGGVSGWCIDGAKAFSTFAGRADVLGILARTDPDPAAGHRGLSLFIAEKTRFHGHDFDDVQPGGGRLTGTAERTLGYRGMHSYTLRFERFFVPGDGLVGGEAGLGRGFYLQMAGFAAGRLQTGGRACGLAQASLEAAARYTAERPQFGRPIVDFQSTRYELGRMQVALAAARQLTYAAARAMDRGAADAHLRAAMAKLLACRVAVDLSQRAQLLHGGWGYAEEFPVARYVADALVLPIFEGVEPILEMKVIGRGLLQAAADA